MNPKIVWQQGLVTAEDISDLRPHILRFHESEKIPGPVRSSCVVAETSLDDLDALVRIWHGQVIKSDPHAIEAFCRAHNFPGASWWRCREGREPYEVCLYTTTIPG